MPVAVREAQKLNQRDPEAEPIIEAEHFDTITGQRLPKGWKRVPSKAPQTYPVFTIPAPEHPALGLRPELACARPGRYITAADHESTTFASDFASRMKAQRAEKYRARGLRVSD